MKLYVCPFCGAQQDPLALEVKTGEMRPPEKTDFNICLACLGVSVFDNGELRRPNEKEELEIRSDRHLQKYIADINREGEKQWRKLQ